MLLYLFWATGGLRDVKKGISILPAPKYSQHLRDTTKKIMFIITGKLLIQNIVFI